MFERRKLLSLIILISTIFCITPLRAESDSVVRTTLLRELGSYPKSQLADVYKNFFQDRFGPGHLLNDTTKSGAYLRSELAETADFSGPLFEPTGADGNYIRVNLSVINDGLISYPEYFDAFVRSVRGIEPPSADEWRAYWGAVQQELDSLGISFPDEDADRQMIAEKLRSGDFTVHHSDRYNAAYQFHYRIMSRDIFEREILPKILKKE